LSGGFGSVKAPLLQGITCRVVSHALFGFERFLTIS